MEKSHRHHFLIFPTTSLGLGSASFRWRACVRQTQHSQFWRRCVLFRPPLVATLSLRRGPREEIRRCCGPFLGDLLPYPGDCKISIPAVTTIFAVTGSEILPQLLWRRVSLQPACQAQRSQKRHHFRKRNDKNKKYYYFDHIIIAVIIKLIRNSIIFKLLNSEMCSKYIRSYYQDGYKYYVYLLQCVVTKLRVYISRIPAL